MRAIPFTIPIIIATLILVALSAAYISSPNFSWWHIPVERHIVIYIKIPVLLTAITVGSAISASAASLQMLLRNPLADPGLIGITSGASLFAAIVILTGTLSWLSERLFGSLAQPYVLAMCCFVGALLSAGLIMSLAKRLRHTKSAVILMGIAISTVAGAIIGWLYLIAPPGAIKSMTFWLMGSLHNTDYQILSMVSPPLIIVLVFVVSQAKRLNWLYLDANAAKLKGLNIQQYETRMLIACAVLVGLSVSIAGSIAFLGLLVPHFVRAFFGYDNRLVIILSALIGSSVLIITALINDLLFSSVVPVSMITATVGGPLFIYALLQQKR